MHEIPALDDALGPERAAAFRSAALSHHVQFLVARVRGLGLAPANRAMLESVGLKTREYSVLSLAAAGIDPSQRELGLFLGMDPSQVVSVVDTLEKRGLVRREVDPRDRRSRIVTVTAEGEQARNAGWAVARRVDAELFSPLDEAERAELLRLLAKIAL